MEKLHKSLLNELKNSKYNKSSLLRLKNCINNIIIENEYSTNDVFDGFSNIKNIVSYFDVNYPWGKNNDNDLIIEEKLNKLYNLIKD